MGVMKKLKQDQPYMAVNPGTEGVLRGGSIEERTHHTYGALNGRDVNPLTLPQFIHNLTEKRLRIKLQRKLLHISCKRVFLIQFLKGI
jgi:hypothetical protein